VVSPTSHLSKPAGWKRRLLFLAALSLAATVVVLSRPWYFAWRAESNLKSGSLIQAAEYFRAASELGRNDAVFLMNRARCHRKLGNLGLMSDDLTAGVAAGADAVDASTEARMAEAQRGNLEALEPELPRLFSSYSDPDEVCEAFVCGCLLKYRLSDALQLLSVWERDYPNDDRLFFLRGRILEHQLDFDGALREYETAVSKNRLNAAAAYNAGRVLQTQKKTELARRQYLYCADVLGDPRPGWIAAAQCSRTLGETAQARQYLDQAATWPRGDIAVAYRIVGEPADAGLVNLAIERGELAFLEENFEAAASEFKKVVDAVPANWRVRYRLSQAQRKLGQNDLAEPNEVLVRSTKAAFEKCDPLISLLKNEPGNVEARFTIGITFLEHISENQGLVWLDSVLDLDPHHAGAHAALAQYFEDHKDDNDQFPLLAAKHRAHSGQRAVQQ
jgi:tetratricopeptide (TPR) repeat protein